MPSLSRRWLLLCSAAAVFLLGLYSFNSYSTGSDGSHGDGWLPTPVKASPFQWKDIPQRYAVTSMMALPTGRPAEIPKIQYDVWQKETAEEKAKRISRQNAVKMAFAHAWDGYKTYAWLGDEVAPISGESRSAFGGWAATLVDSLDTLHIMGFKREFTHAVNALGKIDFTRSTEDEINVFETTIRYLGGFLAAYDLSDNKLLLTKAIEMGDMLYAAFDTPNRMPITRWKWRDAMKGQPQEADPFVLVAEIGSLSLEFTRLSQVSGDPKYFDAVQRIMDRFMQQKNLTKLEGMWPVIVDRRKADFTADNGFSLGAMSDSLYEYLPKQFMLLGGLHKEYEVMYKCAIKAAKEHMFYRPLNKDNLDLLVSGTVKVNDAKVELAPEGQHLVCFAGGMIGIGSQIFSKDDLSIARKLVDGCIWAYESMPSGIMPETFRAISCTGDCQWDEKKWHDEVRTYHMDYSSAVEDIIREKRLQPGFVDMPDRTYRLRPEAIESIFILYRITGDPALQEKAWTMFQAIEKHTRTKIAYAALSDVTVAEPPKWDKMESFWLAETLKYFYLIFSPPDVMSLDDYVFNTEAHPFKRPHSLGGWS